VEETGMFNETMRAMKQLDKITKKTKKAKEALMKELTKSLELYLLTLSELDLCDEKHREKLPHILDGIDNTIEDINILVKVYRDLL
jgi:Na+/phosphate symporter